MESFLSLGRIHLPIDGLFLACGLMLAMALGLRTSRWARIDPDAFWDLGMVTAVSAIVLSRLMLVLENPRIFLHYPWAVLELHELSAGGELATLLVAIWYLYRRRLPVLGVADAASPCLMLLSAFGQLGDYAGGLRQGLPTTVPWAVGSSFGRVHPVELYTAGGLLLAVAMVLWVLARGAGRGIAAAAALLAAGLAYTLTDFFHLPNALYGTDRLDGIEWRGLEFMALGTVLLAWRLARHEMQPGIPTEVPHAF